MRPQPAVTQRVTYEMGVGLEAHWAVRALVGPIGRVELHVRAQVAPAIEGAPAQLTDMRALLQVHTVLMLLHLLLAVKQLATARTLHRLVALNAHPDMRQ